MTLQTMLEYLLKHKILIISEKIIFEEKSEPQLPLWIKEDMVQWSQNMSF